MTKRSTQLRWLAATLVVAAVALAVLWPGRAARSITVTAQFEDTVGLYVGNAVSVLGMLVGKVTGIVPNDGYVEVTLSVDEGIDLPANVQAVTVSTSILTDRHVELTPPYRGGPKLSNGDVLTLPRTRTPVEFDRTLAMADKLSRALGGDGHGQGPLGDLIGIGADISSRSGSDIKTALDQLSQALRLSSDDGTATKQELQSIANSLAELTQAAADNDTTIREFGSNIRQLSDIVASEQLGTGATGAQLNQVLDQAAALLQTNRDGLKNTATNFQRLMGTVEERRRDLAETIDLLPLLATNISNAVDPNVGALRMHALTDKLTLNGQMVKELCNLAGIRDLGCATGTTLDKGPEFGAKLFVDGMAGMLENMATGG